MIGAIDGGAAAAMPGNASIETPTINASPITSVRRTSNRRDVRTCKPLTRMNVIVNSSAGSMTERGMTASSAVNFGKNPEQDEQRADGEGHDATGDAGRLRKSDRRRRGVGADAAG